MQIIRLDQIGSTNTYVAEHHSELLSDTVIVTDNQTAGRGQRGNSWEAEPGKNLTFTILVRPTDFRAIRQFSLSEATAVAIVDVINEELGVEAKIKWPNDIYVGDKKICGILIENVLSGDTLSVCIAGIGVNLNQTVFRSDAPNPTSLLLELGGAGDPLDRREELVLLLGQIANLYIPLTHPDAETSATQDSSDGALPTLQGQYLNALYRLNELHTYVDLTTGETFRGYIRGVEKNACLRIETETGEIKSFAFKELKYIISQ
jgi:BirA family biotin operon repressor/biotin-[acetyl-CoA-carboxylase] ligase